MKFSNNFYSRFYRHYSQAKHEGRLNNIKTGHYKKISVSNPESERTLPLLTKATFMRHKREALSIYKINKKIATKLASQYTKTSKMISLTPKGPSSLNTFQRQREVNLINHENKRIVRRLSSVSSDLSVKSLKKHISFNNSYKKSRQQHWRHTREFLPSNKMYNNASSLRSNSTFPRNTKRTNGKSGNKGIAQKREVDLFVDNVRKYKI